MDLCSARTEAKRRPACCVRIINHRGREVRPYPQKAKRGDSASDNSEGRRETHFVARLQLPEVRTPLCTWGDIGV